MTDYRRIHLPAQGAESFGTPANPQVRGWHDSLSIFPSLIIGIIIMSLTHG